MDDEVKDYKAYSEQVEILRRRGMLIPDTENAITTLRRVNYYRLSGYWYPFRQFDSGSRTDLFFPGTHFDEVVALYEFDARLRTVAFSALAPIELTVRALLGHELGRTDACAHLKPDMLGPTANRGSTYARWRKSYEKELQNSREDFVEHHKQKYGGILPVWAAVELLDWGGLAYLYSFSPRNVQDAVAERCDLTAPQLTSWLKSLNVVRNICAHHGRFFNRVHALAPKLPRTERHSELLSATEDWSRTFGQLTLIQYLSIQFETGQSKLLPLVLKTFPEISTVPLSHMGAAEKWQESSVLWQV